MVEHTVTTRVAVGVLAVLAAATFSAAPLGQQSRPPGERADLIVARDGSGDVRTEGLGRVVPALAAYISVPVSQAFPGGPAPGVVPWNRCLDQPDVWYGSADAIRIADNVVLYQRKTGGWPKNIDMAQALDATDRARVEADKADTDSTIDNGATTTELRFLARAYAATSRERFRASFLAGLDYLFRAQYPNGGWPQFYPLREDYSRHITFNDNAMINVMELLRDVAGAKNPLAFVDAGRRTLAGAGVERGIAVILAAQVKVDGRLTAWCAQHDVETLEPRMARAYEHPSLSGKESVEIVRFLMQIEKPTPAIVAAVEAAVAWYRSVAIKGVRVENRRDVSLPGGADRVAVADPGAPPLWARFYQIGTNRPIFSGRDSVIKYSLVEIELERRLNYSWLGPYATELLATDYPRWKARLGPAGKARPPAC